MEVLMALGKEDIELVDALVANGCISRPVGREVVVSAQPGRVASFIMERGLCNLAAHSGYAIVERLAKYEAERIDWNEVTAEALEAINRHDFSSRGRSHVDCAEMHDVCPHKPETD
jgi:hypothetical protein